MALADPHPLRFLALCARPEVNEAVADRLAEEAAVIERWDLLLAAAEYHGIAGLLHAHLKAAGVSLPDSTRRTLDGLLVRQRHATRARLQVLTDILELFEGSGIEALVLKGAALALTVYRDPGDRPFADLDLWVESQRTDEAQACLLGEGFAVHPAHGLPEHRHLAPVSREHDGVRVIVELHHRVEAVGSSEATALLERSSHFRINGRSARTLGPADTLAQLHHHLIHHLVFHRHLRLKWVADLIGVAERFGPAIDWRELRSRYPALPGALAMLHPLSPLSKTLQESSGIVLAGREPRGIDAEISVLPEPEATGVEAAAFGLADRPDWLAVEGRRTLVETLWPSEWRLRLFSGADGKRALLPYRFSYLGKVAAFAVEIWRSHRGSLATLSRRPWIRSRLPPTRHRDT